jgi:hypothetical protein
MPLINYADLINKARAFVEVQPGADDIVYKFESKRTQEITKYPPCYGCFGSRWLSLINAQGQTRALPCTCVDGTLIDENALRQIESDQALQLLLYIETCTEFASNLGVVINQKELAGIFNIPWNDTRAYYDISLKDNNVELFPYLSLFKFLYSQFEDLHDFKCFKESRRAA